MKYSISYHEALLYALHQRILCNNVVNLSLEYEDNVTDDYIYQYYLVDLAQWLDMEDIRKIFPELLFAYCTELDVWVLLVNHFGTPSHGIETYTTNESVYKAILSRRDDSSYQIYKPRFTAKKYHER